MAASPLELLVQKTSFLSKVTTKLSGVGTRLLFSIILLFILSVVLSGSENTGGFIFSSYVGAIYLFPLNAFRNFTGRYATAMGAFQFFILSALGLHWAFALLWAGVQNWLCKLLFQRESITTRDWLIWPLLLFAVTAYLTQTPSVAPYTYALPSILLVSVASVASYKLLQLYFFRPRHRATLMAFSARLTEAIASSKTPPQFMEPLKKLQHFVVMTAKGTTLPNKASAYLIKGYSIIHNELVALQKYKKTPGIPSGTRQFFVALNTFIDDIDLLLKKEPTHAYEEDITTITATPQERIAFLHELSQELTSQPSSFPPHIQEHSKKLYAVTQKILDQMRHDPSDVEAGDRFLSRYLPATIKLMGTYDNLYSNGAEHNEIQDALKKCEETFIRLQEAFLAEHRFLMKNDTMNLKAELATLDTLMRIDGK